MPLLPRSSGKRLVSRGLQHSAGPGTFLCRGGRRLEFDEYVRLRGASLVRLGRLLTGDQHLGEDLAQDVLARAFVRWKKIANVDSPEAYLRRMLVNAAISRSR